MSPSEIEAYYRVASKQCPQFKITGKNNGKKAEATEETSLVGKVVNTEAQLTEVDLFISNDIKDRGLVELTM